MSGENRKTPFWAASAADTRSDDALFEAARRDLDLEGEDHDSSTLARWALLVRSTPEVFEYAMKLADSADPKTRRLAVLVMAGMNDPASRTERQWGQRLYTDKSIPLLARLAAEDPEPDVRIATAVALEEIGQVDALPILLRLSDDSEPLVRERTAFAISSFVDDDGAQARTLERLLALAQDADSKVRDAAVFSLASAELDRPAVRDALAAALDDSDSEVASDAAAGLILLGDPRGAAALFELVRRGELDDGFFVMEAAEACRGAALDEAIDDAMRSGHAPTAVEELRTDVNPR